LHNAPLKSKIVSIIFPVSSYTVNGGVMEFDYKWKYWEASRGWWSGSRKNDHQNVSCK